MKFLSILLILSSLGFFAVNNFLNEKIIREYKINFVEHPQFLPSPEFLNATTFGFKNLRADLLWLQTVQYVGGNAMSANYKKYLYEMVDLITHLNPKFSLPYEVGMRLMPDYNFRYEDLNDSEKLENVLKAEEIGKKGLENFCNLDLVEKIGNDFDFQNIINNPEYSKVCETYEIPYQLGFYYYYYRKDSENSAKFYKVASAIPNSPEGAKSLMTIFTGQSGGRDKSFKMLLNLANSMDGDQVCQEFAQVFLGANLEEISLTGKLGNFSKEFSGLVNEYFGEFEDGKDSSCLFYVRKASREINLAYIENGYKKYLSDTISPNPELHASTEFLLENGYIDFIPEDYQQYENQGIVYVYDDEIGTFKEKMDVHQSSKVIGENQRKSLLGN